ncbi:hypothetical protein LCDVSa046R [Lymphocystis disease virus 3]|uniref:Uncharacterized protein n=1 Tax=Lymphocystis disease virus 3 TaxID=2560566 RepID=A0A1B2RVV4_9VIRU|nr:hypothetical protein BZK12_gp046 [Lymphocystis disease virus Sa]AOC55130.1 hypothetical protein LCDVSa046R [Lymphocystis disease virus 3]
MLKSGFIVFAMSTQKFKVENCIVYAVGFKTVLYTTSYFCTVISN